MQATAEDYKSVIFSGCSIEYNKIHICNLRNYNKRIVADNEYQVWSDKHKEYKIYKNIDDAVNKFIELKGKRA